MNPRDIRKYLRAGRTPAEIPNAEPIGSGIETDAYRIGNFVVKEYTRQRSRSGKPKAISYHCGSVRRVRRELYNLGVSKIRTWYVHSPENRWYMIQPLVIPYTVLNPYGERLVNSIVIDVHNNNITQLSDGRIVAFDW